jgi:hypothetical protein
MAPSCTALASYSQRVLNRNMTISSSHSQEYDRRPVSPERPLQLDRKQRSISDVEIFCKGVSCYKREVWLLLELLRFVSGFKLSWVRGKVRYSCPCAAIKRHERMEVQLHSFLQKALNGGERQASCYRRFPSDKDFWRSPLSRRLGGPQICGPQSRSGHSEGDKDLVHLTAIEQQLLGRSARSAVPCTDRALPLLSVVYLLLVIWGTEAVTKTEQSYKAPKAAKYT